MKNKLLIIGSVWPEPKSTAAGCRMMQLIHFFLDEGYKITFASTCNTSEHATNLEDIEVEQKEIELNDSSFDEFVKNLNPDSVLFDRFMTEEQFGWRVHDNCPEAIRILDTEDLHFLRKARQEAFKSNKTLEKSFLNSDTAKREIASIYRCDLSLIISEYEMTVLKYDFKIEEDLLMYLPFMYPKLKEDISSNLPEYENRSDFITIGNFRHPPNLDAAQYLKGEIWPLIRSVLPKAKLHIYGSYPTQKVLDMNDKKNGFLVHGKADDVNEIMQKARVCFAPLRFGAGLKGKVFDALRNGTPCIMSDVAAEGIFTEIEKFSFIKNDPKEFAATAIDYYQSKFQWLEAQDLGFEILNTEFDDSVHKQRLRLTLKNLKENLSERRSDNFIGQLLQHHTMQSSKYMSRWIEVKNSK